MNSPFPKPILGEKSRLRNGHFRLLREGKPRKVLQTFRQYESDLNRVYDLKMGWSKIGFLFTSGYYSV